MMNTQDHDDHHCPSCGEEFSESDFDLIDDEYDAPSQLCPDCKRAERISNQTCEYDENPAKHEVELGYLCDDCFDNYADGYNQD